MNAQHDYQLIAWLKRASRGDITVPPEILNGNGEIVETVLQANQQGGQEGIRRALEVIGKEAPGLIAELNRPALIRPLSELKNRPSPAWLIPDMIQERSLNVLYGPPGGGKTFQAIHMALEVAQRASVLYGMSEGLDTMADRFEAAEKYHKRRSDKIGYFEAINFLDPANVERFIVEAQQTKPALSIFDTLAMYMPGGDENSAGVMGLFLQACRHIIQELGTAVLVVHHTGKSGSSERGSSALRGNADMMIEVLDNDGVISLRCDKSRNTAGFDTQYRRLEPVELDNGRSNRVVVESDRTIASNGKLTENQTQILEILAGLWSEGARSRDLEKAVSFSPRTLYSVLGNLKRRGLIDRDGRYDPWILTEAGGNMARELGYTDHA